MSKTVPTIPVMMCVWRRPHLLQRTFDQLAGQFRVKPHLYLWNNNIAVRDEVDRIVAENGHRLPVSVRHSPTNVGCFGRFIHAQPLIDKYPYFVVIDDDQRFDEPFLHTLWHEKVELGAVAAYARGFIRNDPYWSRTRLEPGEPATYCGPGGMIIDRRVLADKRLLKCPDKYWMMDDIWLSHLLHHRRRATVRKSSAVVEMTDGKNDTYHGLKSNKVEFLDALRDKGWKV